MKKIIFMALFATIILGGVYGQTPPENRWLIGSWVRTEVEVEDGWSLTSTWIFNDNGSGRRQQIWTRGNEREDGSRRDFLFSTSGTTIIIYYIANNNITGTTNLNITRINDQIVVIENNIYNKRN